MKNWANHPTPQEKPEPCEICQRSVGHSEEVHKEWQEKRISDLETRLEEAERRIRSIISVLALLPLG